LGTKVLGNQGEQAAAEALVQKGYVIEARNFRVPVGEIDIIARRQGVLVFVEVKTRRSLHFGRPAEAVGWKKQQRIIRAACWYLKWKHLEHMSCRFDVIEVYCTPAGSWSVQQLENAFELQGG